MPEQTGTRTMTSFKALTRAQWHDLKNPRELELPGASWGVAALCTALLSRLPCLMRDSFALRIPLRAEIAHENRASQI